MSLRLMEKIFYIKCNICESEDVSLTIATSKMAGQYAIFRCEYCGKFVKVWPDRIDNG